MYDADVGLRNDSCAQTTRDYDNQRMQNYMLAGGQPAVACPVGGPRRPDLDHRNMHVHRGYGNADACTIDGDSAMRNNVSGLTNPRETHQLFTRMYQAVPDLRGGLPRPDIESRLLSGDLDETRHCTGGSAWDRNFFDMLPCVANVQNPEHIVPAWTWGGEPTRDYVRRPDACSLLRPR